jgi:hypothetical protein
VIYRIQSIRGLRTPPSLSAWYTGPLTTAAHTYQTPAGLQCQARASAARQGKFNEQVNMSEIRARKEAGERTGNATHLHSLCCVHFRAEPKHNDRNLRPSTASCLRTPCSAASWGTHSRAGRCGRSHRGITSYGATCGWGGGWGREEREACTTQRTQRMQRGRPDPRPHPAEQRRTPDRPDPESEVHFRTMHKARQEIRAPHLNTFFVHLTQTSLCVLHGMVAGNSRSGTESIITRE